MTRIANRQEIIPGEDKVIDNRQGNRGNEDVRGNLSD